MLKQSQIYFYNYLQLWLIWIGVGLGKNGSALIKIGLLKYKKGDNSNFKQSIYILLQHKNFILVRNELFLEER